MEDSNQASSKMPIMIRNIKAAQLDAFLKGLDELLSLLRQQMHSNPHDPRTPNPLFFTWDFVQRTRTNLSRIPVEKLESNDRDALETYGDCVGRAIMAEIVLSDTTATAAAMRGGEMVDLGGEIGRAAKGAAVSGGGWEGVRHVR